MSERKAIDAIEALDKDRYATAISVRQILGVLHEYIPRACVREAEEKLFDAFFINGTELTSNIMRKKYEQWKKLQLDLGMLSHVPSAIIMPKEQK